MKKLLLVGVLVLTLIVSLFSLTGCKSDGKENKGKDGNSVVTINGINYSLNKERALCNMTFKYPEEAKFPTEEEKHLTMKIY